MQLEEQNKKRLQLNRLQLEEQKIATQARPNRNSLPPDYQMQLMQLEEQNKRRLQLEEQNIPTQSRPERNPLPSDYQIQLIRLEEQNKPRPVHAKAERNPPLS
jgi:hypothetical protein